MGLRKKKWKASLWCRNCGKDFKKKLPFGVSAVENQDGFYLWDSVNGNYVNEKGQPTETANWLFCPKCGDRRVHKTTWVIRRGKND